MCFKQQLEFRINNVMRKTDNAVCPKCLDHWDFDEHYAWSQLSEEERKQFIKQGYLLVVCEDCEYSEDLEEFLDLVFEHDLFVTFSR